MKTPFMINSDLFFTVSHEGSISQTSVSFSYVSVIVSSLPVLCLYPLVQKYFAQGVMIGSLKG